MLSPPGLSGRPSESADLLGGIASDSAAGCARPIGSAALRERSNPSLLAEALVKPVDEVRHRLEALRDHAEAVLAEVLRLDVQRLGQRSHHVVGWHWAVAVDEMVQVARRELRLLR